MKKYKGLVCMPMWQEIEVSAENHNEAWTKMFDAFDMSKAYEGEPYVYDCEESGKYLWNNKE